jgi:hypothetical protein
MTQPHIVSLAVRYLDREVDDPRWSLMGLMEYVDAWDKTIIETDEVNEALRQRPEIWVVRLDGGIVFSSGPGERKVTDADLKETYDAYTKDFALRLEKLRSRE